MGHILEAKAAGRLSGSAELGLELVSVRLSTGTDSQGIDIVTQEISSKGAGRGGNTPAKTGSGAEFGVVVGALAGGCARACFRAASGGALGLGATLSRTVRR